MFILLRRISLFLLFGNAFIRYKTKRCTCDESTALRRERRITFMKSRTAGESESAERKYAERKREREREREKEREREREAGREEERERGERYIFLQR